MLMSQSIISSIALIAFTAAEHWQRYETWQLSSAQLQSDQVNTLTYTLRLHRSGSYYKVLLIELHFLSSLKVAQLLKKIMV